ncbi:hypothetical protein [uncultured Roseovarius sp.]|uniref:hypothetical protein n=1 Tax=uncultured Roseovarius sp. TaxID=293344 RepID=UPI0026265BDE|nr:hypothetical protein [uncultured Roseovarius sp.]
MQRNIVFLATLWGALGLSWLLSGERFLDLMFAMPDLGKIDDLVLEVVIQAEDAKDALGAPDLFGALRAALHRITGLG